MLHPCLFHSGQCVTRLLSLQVSDQTGLEVFVSNYTRTIPFAVWQCYTAWSLLPGEWSCRAFSSKCDLCPRTNHSTETEVPPPGESGVKRAGRRVRTPLRGTETASTCLKAYAVHYIRCVWHIFKAAFWTAAHGSDFSNRLKTDWELR